MRKVPRSVGRAGRPVVIGVRRIGQPAS